MRAIDVEGTLREEVNVKNDEILQLRKEIMAKFNFNSSLPLSGTFD
jgi:hypothetical protein